MSRRSSEPHADIIIRERSTDEHPALTVEVDSSYDEDFIEALKSLPRGARAWDAANSRWRVHPNYLLNVQELVKKYFPRSRMLVGDRITDLHTGTTVEQTKMF